MTDKPTPDQIQRACDLANGGSCDWTYREYGESGILTALADTIAELDEQTRAVMAIHAELIATTMEKAAMQAERDKARADLGEIDRIAVKGGWGHHHAAAEIRAVAAIAARHRVETDPVDDLINATCQASVGWSVRRYLARTAPRPNSPSAGLKLGGRHDTR